MGFAPVDECRRVSDCDSLELELVDRSDEVAEASSSDLAILWDLHLVILLGVEVGAVSKVQPEFQQPVTVVELVVELEVELRVIVGPIESPRRRAVQAPRYRLQGWEVDRLHLVAIVVGALVIVVKPEQEGQNKVELELELVVDM